jgi:hypothetical protein
LNKKSIFFVFVLFFFFLIFFSSCGIPNKIDYVKLPILNFDNNLNFIWFQIPNDESGFKGYVFYYSVRDEINPIFFKCFVKVLENNTFVVSNTTPQLLLSNSDLNKYVYIYYNDPLPSTINVSSDSFYISIYDKDRIAFSDNLYKNKKIYFKIVPYVLNNAGNLIKVIDIFGRNIIEINF